MIARRPRTPWHLLLYLLSLPERIVRSILGLLGALGLWIGRFLPPFVRRTRFYRVAVERQLRVLSEAIGGAQSTRVHDEEKVDAKMVRRKVVGDTLDNLALATLHVSPIWILLALSDVIEGASNVTQEILGELTHRGIIPEDARVQNVDDLLRALSRTSGSIADTVSLPPLEVAHLKATVSTLRDNLRGIDLSSVVGTTDLEEALVALKAEAQRENTSLLRMSAKVTAHWLAATSRLTRTISLSALVGVTTGGKILARELVTSYLKSLNEIREQGFLNALGSELTPQTRAIGTNFRYDNIAWTELLLTGFHLRTADWRYRPRLLRIEVGEPSELETNVF